MISGQPPPPSRPFVVAGQVAGLRPPATRAIDADTALRAIPALGGVLEPLPNWSFTSCCTNVLASVLPSLVLV